jgi:hypothetical protein
MNEPFAAGNPRDDDARFERLIDGELSPDEYRTLLATLDDEPGGWRRCALAFLEDQAFASELGSLRRSLDWHESEQPTPRPRAPVAPWFMWLAVAASFLVAFGLGLLAPGILTSPSQDLAITGNNKSGLTVASTDRDAPNNGLRHETLRPIANVRLVVDGPNGETTEAGEVPLYDVGQDLERFFSQAPPTLGPELVELLQRRGHRIERQQQYVPAMLDDGRQIIVPVERYEIMPGTSRAY